MSLITDRRRVAAEQDAAAQRLEASFEPPRRDPFYIDPFPLMRDAMAAQSLRALELARAAGLETP
jgi:hypothetical protein